MFQLAEVKKKLGTYKQQDRLDAFWRECEKGQEISQQQFLSTKPRESRQISVHFSSLQFVKIIFQQQQQRLFLSTSAI
jgi:hypothetical protein